MQETYIFMGDMNLLINKIKIIPLKLIIRFDIIIMSDLISVDLKNGIILEISARFVKGIGGFCKMSGKH